METDPLNPINPAEANAGVGMSEEGFAEPAMAGEQQSETSMHSQPSSAETVMPSMPSMETKPLGAVIGTEAPETTGDTPVESLAEATADPVMEPATLELSKKKMSPILIIVLVLVFLGAAAYFGYPYIKDMLSANVEMPVAKGGLVIGEPANEDVTDETVPAEEAVIEEASAMIDDAASADEDLSEEIGMEEGSDDEVMADETIEENTGEETVDGEAMAEEAAEETPGDETIEESDEEVSTEDTEMPATE